MIQPSSVYELDVGTKEKMLLKQQPVPTYDPTRSPPALPPIAKTLSFAP